MIYKILCLFFFAAFGVTLFMHWRNERADDLQNNLITLLTDISVSQRRCNDDIIFRYRTTLAQCVPFMDSLHRTAILEDLEEGSRLLLFLDSGKIILNNLSASGTNRMAAVREYDTYKSFVSRRIPAFKKSGLDENVLFNRYVGLDISLLDETVGTPDNNGAGVSAVILEEALTTSVLSGLEKIVGQYGGLSHCP